MTSATNCHGEARDVLTGEDLVREVRALVHLASRSGFSPALIGQAFEEVSNTLAGEIRAIGANAAPAVGEARRRIHAFARAAADSTRRPGGGVWELQTSNSYRRIGTRGHGDGDVLSATNHLVDRHPDLLAAAGVLDYVVAAQPLVVLEMLRDLDESELRRALLLDRLSVARILASAARAAVAAAGEAVPMAEALGALDRLNHALEVRE